MYQLIRIPYGNVNSYIIKEDKSVFLSIPPEKDTEIKF